MRFQERAGRALLSLAAGLALGQPATAAPAALTNLSVTAAWPAGHVAVPGEALAVSAIVRNQGLEPARNVDVQMCVSSGGCLVQSVALIPPASARTVEFTFRATAAHRQANPHFFSVTVDPANRIAETSEQDNRLQSAKPVFVVDLETVAPALPVEHDDIIQLQDGRALSYERIDYPAGGPGDIERRDDPLKFQPHPVTGFQETPGPGGPGQPRIDPRVVQQDQETPPGGRLQYVIRYRHAVPMPPLPPLPDASGRFASGNTAALSQRAARFEAVRRARLEAASGLVNGIRQGGGRVVESYTLAGSLLVDAPRGLLSALADHPQLLHVEAVLDGSRPPGTVADGRALIDTDPYFNGGATGAGFMALLDTGVRNTHTLLTGPDHIAFEEDCVNGDALCNNAGAAAYDPDDDCWDHGTSTTAILTGNTNLGNDYRGITSGWVDVWKVYGGGCGGLNTTAVLRGYDQAVLWGDQIVVAEIQSTQSDTGSIAVAADDAFDSGTLTIAANGNYGPNASTVASPAIAHKAIGVGNYDVDSLAAIASQSLGPAPDLRYKPDIQAPTNTITASTISSTTVNGFSGTSGATPYAAGAASLFADWYSKTANTAANAGQIYAGLINSGPLDWGRWNDAEGVGKFALPLSGTVYTGSRNVTLWSNQYVTISVPAGATEISAAIWWPESWSATHCDIDLYLQRPDGSTSESSLSGSSIFEHVKVSAPIVAGNRDVRIYGFSVPALTVQTVYYAIHVK